MAVALYKTKKHWNTSTVLCYPFAGLYGMSSESINLIRDKKTQMIFLKKSKKLVYVTRNTRLHRLWKVVQCLKSWNWINCWVDEMSLYYIVLFYCNYPVSTSPTNILQHLTNTKVDLSALTLIYPPELDSTSCELLCLSFWDGRWLCTYKICAGVVFHRKILFFFFYGWTSFQSSLL